MEYLFTLDKATYYDAADPILQQKAMQALEDGRVIYLRDKSFSILAEENQLLSPSIVKANTKNISLKPSTPARVSGSILEDEELTHLENMMQRYAEYATELLLDLCPHYQSGLIRGRTSFRPVEIQGRPSSYKKDDKRLHVDAFPATPVQGKRILRVFCNINPQEGARVWHLGEPFKQVIAKFLPPIPAPKAWQAKLLKWFRLTKTQRTAYDHYMLHIHDSMKGDEQYQQQVEKLRVDFPPNSTWITYTDITSHAALGGQYLLEQTFYLEPQDMLDESKAPLRILEAALGKALV